MMPRAGSPGMNADPFDLQRFVDAQAPVHGCVLDELRAGRKRTHWMWFVFPQLAGFGHSATAQRFAIHGMRDAGTAFCRPDRIRIVRIVGEARDDVPVQVRHLVAERGEVDLFR